MAKQNYIITIRDEWSGREVEREVTPWFFEQDATEIGEFIQNLQANIDPRNLEKLPF